MLKFIKHSIVPILLLFLAFCVLDANTPKMDLHTESKTFLSILNFAIDAILLTLSVYTILIGIAGIFPHTKIKKNKSPQPKFLLITAAHNESAVIEKHVENLLFDMDYPKELYDVVVLADNCTDNTASLAKNLGAIVWERTNHTEKGKGYALKWALHEKANLAQYDGVCIFDADNLADNNFLKVMAEYLQAGYVAIQGYLDTKNPWDSWVSAAYASSYWFMNRFWQRPRTKIGLSGALGGTGFCLSSKTLQVNQWEAMSLTEDLEYTVRLILQNERVFWTNKTKVYDEKPVKFNETVPQRTRWMQGHWSTAFRYSRPLIQKIFSDKISMQTFRCLDNLLYLWQPVVIFLTALNLFFSIFQIVLGNHWYSSWLSMFVPSALWVTLVGFALFLPLVAFSLENASWKSFLYYPLFLLFNLTWIFVTINGLLYHKNTEWSHTKHNRSIDLNEVSSKGVN